MAKINGAGGTAKFDTTEIFILSWTLDITGETINVTDSSNLTWEAHIASGFKGWSGTFEGFQMTGTPDPAIGGSEAELILEFASGRDYTGNAIVTSVGTTVDVPGTDGVKKSFTFQGTDDVALTNA